MRFIKLVNSYRAEYAIFQLESSKEKDFFKNLPFHLDQNSFSRSTVYWLINSKPPAILRTDENEIMILNHNPYSFNLLANSQPKPISDFLDELFKMKIIENNAREELENPRQEGVIAYLKASLASCRLS